MDCLFCNIAAKKEAGLIYHDETVIAFNDIQPEAPIHLLVVPKRHISTLNELSPTDNELVGHMIHVASQLAEQQRISQSGYRLVLNCNSQGGQTIFHIHLHLLAGRQMTWPPG